MCSDAVVRGISMRPGSGIILLGGLGPLFFYGPRRTPQQTEIERREWEREMQT